MTSTMPSAIGIARGIVRSGATTSSPSVAIRAYPANAKKRKPRGLQYPVPALAERGHRARRVGAAAEYGCRHDEREAPEHERHDHAGRQHGLRDAEIVDGGQYDDGQHGKRPRERRRGVGGERQRHRRAARELADDEAPAGEEAPRIAETLAAIDVRAPGLRIKCRERRRRRRVAVRDEPRNEKADQQAVARSARSGRNGGKDACAEHRA
jgi:hypothetical protein